MKLLGILVLVVASVSARDVQVIPVKDGLSGNANTTRYWDCCKPACGWPRANLKKTVVACAIDGVAEITDNQVLSGCQGGDAFACTRQHSYAVNNSFAMGFASAFFGGLDQDMCCTCFLLSFQGLSTAKEMLVQVINTGTDYPKNSVTFDLATPGGGVGMYNGCTTQWNAPADGWGDRYGGVRTREECNQLPDQLREFCYFRFDFLEAIPNPPATYTQVECPTELSSSTECEIA